MSRSKGPFDFLSFAMGEAYATLGPVNALRSPLMDASDHSAKASRLARSVSIVGHPMVLVPVAMTLAMRGRVSVAQAAAILGTVVVAMLAVAAYLVHGVRRGTLSHVDVSKREERGGFYRVSMAATACAAAALHFAGAPRSAVVGTACAFALFAVGSLVNRVIKASLHTAFAVVAAGVVGVGEPWAFGLLLATAAAVAWSRIALSRHTPAEVFVGALLGTVASLGLAWARNL